MISFHPDKSVEFAFYRPGATRVHLAGDFNRWSSQHQSLTRDSDGWWRIRLRLTPGVYRFKYLVDGSIWEADFAAFGIEPDAMGGWHSMLCVGEDAMTLAAA